MAREFSGVDFGARAFKFCANITSGVIISICDLGVEIIMSILKMFAFICLLKFSNSMQFRKVHFSSL
jgi:hypothetical protein